MFFDRIDVFWLSQAPHVRLPGGEGCFPGVPERSPQDILSSHGLQTGEVQILDPRMKSQLRPGGGCRSDHTSL